MAVKVKVKLSGRHAEDYLGQLPVNQKPQVKLDKRKALPSKKGLR